MRPRPRKSVRFSAAGDIVGRVGGDEFVIFMKNADSESVMKKAETLNGTIASLSGCEKIGAPVSGSVGAAFYPGDGSSYDELFRKADTAMYAAKKNGKNSFRVYFSGMDFSLGSEAESAHVSRRKKLPDGFYRRLRRVVGV